MSLDHKKITISLLRGRNCDNCLYQSSTVSIISGTPHPLHRPGDEYCHFKDIHDLPKLRICESWKG